MAGEQNVESAKRAYAAFSAGDAEGAMENMADDLEWITPGNSAISGTVRGKQEVGALWAKFAEKGFTTSPQYPRAAGARAQPSRCPTRQQRRSVGRRVDGSLGARRRRRCQRRAHARNRRRSSGRQAATARCRMSSKAVTSAVDGCVIASRR